MGQPQPVGDFLVGLNQNQPNRGKSVRPIRKGEERPCRWCGKLFTPQMVDHSANGFSVKVPRFGGYCAECGPQIDQLQREEEEKMKSSLISKQADELANLNPEAALLSRGFSDAELFGKHLGNFRRNNHALEERWKVARDYAAGEIEASALFFYGFPGRGKTHLARGIARSFLQQGKDIRYWKLGDIIAKCKSLMSGGGETPDQYISWICKFPGLAIIDELGRSAGKEWDIDSVVFPLLDRRQDRQTIWISNYPPDYLGGHYDEAVQSRLCNSRKVRHLEFPQTLNDFRLATL